MVDHQSKNDTVVRSLLDIWGITEYTRIQNDITQYFVYSYTFESSITDCIA